MQQTSDICYLVATRKQHYLSKHDEKLQLVLLIKTENCKKIYSFVLRPIRHADAVLAVGMFVDAVLEGGAKTNGGGLVDICSMLVAN